MPSPENLRLSMDHLRGRSAREWVEAAGQLLTRVRFVVEEVSKSAGKFLGGAVLVGTGLLMAAHFWSVAHLSDDALRQDAEFRQPMPRTVADDRDDCLALLIVGEVTALGGVGLLGYWFKTLPFRKSSNLRAAG